MKTLTTEQGYRKITLSDGTVTLVDEDDYEALNQYSWYKWRSGNNWYAVRTITVKYPKQQMFMMHRVVLEAPEGVMVDHINGNSLDNRRSNLRLCNNTQNQQNAKLRVDNKTGYKGVTQHKMFNKFQAKIKHNGKQIHLGLHDTVKEAAQAYNQKAKELFGEFARLNEI